MGTKGVARTPFVLMLLAVSQAFSDFKGSLQSAGGASGLSTVNDPSTIVAGGINAILGVSGIVLICYLVYAGILYVQAGADPEKAKKAKSIIINSVIGIILIAAAYVIANFLIGLVISSVQPTAAPK